MERRHLRLICCWLLSHLSIASLAWGQFDDKSPDLQALLKVETEFDVKLLASEPLVRQPCSMGSVGTRPQCCSPKPETPSDRVVIVQDTAGDGCVDRVKELAPGFNAIQGHAWHGRGLWVAERAVSGMADMSKLFTGQPVADLATFLLSMQTQAAVPDAKNTTTSPSSASERSSFRVAEEQDRLRISLGGQPIVDFVFHDENILRPYFANARLANGMQVTRNHPPIDGEDAVDHHEMHPGIWLGFGDLSGQDFWRNKAPIEHVRFVNPPTLVDGRLEFSTECRLKTSNGSPLCLLTNDITLTARPSGWMLWWTAAFRADQRSVAFGDQEEMGFGARVATPLIEKNGGVIRSSTGMKSAKETWGKAAKWCDYSGTGVRAGGIMLMASEKNFRESWWHNRDYGVFVANPFGREVMKQGPKSSIEIAKGQSLQLRFGALIHDGQEIDLAGEYKIFLEHQ